MRYGLIGEKLSHSWSPQIHKAFGDYDYRLYEVAPHQLESFLKQKDLAGLNVTIPYKKAVMPYCKSVSKAAAEIGSVNTLCFTEDGIFGDNTDCDGFFFLLQRANIAVTGKKVLILGSGGTSRTVQYCVRALGAKEIVVVSRNGAVNYNNLAAQRDAEIIINTTPVGMYPNVETSPVSFASFPACVGVVDVVYHPLRTKLVQEAAKLGIPSTGGLPMLVMQAAGASQLFTGAAITKEQVETVLAALQTGMENIVLIGMPGSGKTSIGSLLADRMERTFVDTDQIIEKKTGCSAAELIQRFGEMYFRDVESAVIQESALQSGMVIATGGGAVLRPENRQALAQNGRIYWILRDLDKLSTDERPLSMNLEQLFQEREAAYRDAADVMIENNSLLLDAVEKIMEAHRR